MNKRKHKNVVLVSVPGHSVIKPSEEEKRFWNNYLSLLKHEGVYTVSENRSENIGNSSNQHIGLLYLARILKDRGHDVTYIAPANDTTDDELTKMVLNASVDADYIGYSFHTCGEPLAEEIAGKVKQVSKPKQIAGGPHVSGFTQVPSGKNIEVYFRGRSHWSLPWFIEQGSDQTIIGSKEFPKGFYGLDIPFEFPNPDYSFMTVDDLPAARVYTSLGCGRKNPCVFCGSIVDHRRYVATNGDAVMQNIRDLVERFDSEFMYFGDEDFFRNPKHSEEIVRRLAAEYKGRLRYSVQASVPTLRSNRPLLEAIAESGMCNEIQVGVESSNSKILDMAKKSMRMEDVSEIGKVVQDKGIKFFGYWLSWLPGENEYTHQVTTDKICELLDGGGMDYVEACIVVPFPGTELDSRKESFGIQIVNPDYSNWRGENMPVFTLKGAPSREKMYQLYLERLDRIAEVYSRRMPADLKQEVGVDPFKVMTGF